MFFRLTWMVGIELLLFSWSAFYGGTHIASEYWIITLFSELIFSIVSVNHKTKFGVN